ncbi:MAG: quinone-dependent dihydroorotate dehydrogenase [Sphingomicrobium sp.]
MALYPILRPLIFRLDAERAHRLTIAALKLRSGSAFSDEPPRTPSLQSNVAGLRFLNPVGLAAGFDKNAEVPQQALGLGFGFVEVGTLTPSPQSGNPQPRLFRLEEDRAVINRMGFNNEGQEAAIERLRTMARGTTVSSNPGVIGVNIGANKDSPDRIADYVVGVRAMAPFADYLTVNISSPNTPGLRNLQTGGELAELLAAVANARVEAGVRDRAPPIFLKVAPDLADGDHERIVRAVIAHGIDGLIVANTTVSRPPLASGYAGEQGGLSGAPLGDLALRQLKIFRSVVGRDLPLIAVGGIASADDAWARIRAGASLVQLYSALVYEGPGLARRIVKGLAERLAREGFANIADAVG